jgi:hypothetical protein
MTRIAPVVRMSAAASAMYATPASQPPRTSVEYLTAPGDHR